MAPRAEDRMRRDRQAQGGAVAVSIVVVGVLAFTWPFLRTPLLSIGLSYAHLLAAWAIVVLGLYLLSRSLAPTGKAGGDRA